MLAGLPARSSSSCTPLGDRTVKVILTTRDLARLIPAQWQSALRQGNSWTLTEYSHAVAGLSVVVNDTRRTSISGSDRTTEASFAGGCRGWSRQRHGRDPASVGFGPRRAVATVLLRNPAAPDRYETKDVRNTSLGAASAEVLRRLNATEAIGALSRQRLRDVRSTAGSHVE